MNSKPVARKSRPMRILTFTSLYPNRMFPENGIFVETRLRQLLRRKPELEARVVAPVPWFPFPSPRFGVYGRMASVPRREVLNGISIEHPAFLVVPKLSWMFTPLAMAAQSYPTLRRLIAEGFDFDVIDAHYVFPDGVAAAILARSLRKPFVMTARGTDINQIPRYAIPRRMILAAARQCAEMVTVCAALKHELIALGAESSKITVLRNGVDLELFYPQDRAPARASFGMTRFALVSVGHLTTRKGHDLVIGALPFLPDSQLFIAGSGPEEGRLKALAKKLNVSDRVCFLGILSQDRLRALYSAADSLVLASSHEGWANVLLESMAGGAPVVASNDWGTPEVVAAPEAGVLMQERSSTGIADAVRFLRVSLPARDATRRFAEQFSWDATSDGQLEIFERVARAGHVDAPRR